MNISLKHIVRIAITLAIVIGSSYIALRNINLDILFSTLLNARYEWVLLSIPVMLVSHWLRALRWKTMLSPVVEKPSLLNMFSAVMIGYAVNNVIPKGGELMRPILYSRRDKVPLSTVMASMIVERFFFDAIMVLLFIAGVFIFQRSDIEKAFPWFSWAQMLSVIGILASIIILILIIAFFPALTDWLLKVTIRPFSQTFYERIHKLTDTFEHGFEIIKTPSQYVRLTLESFGIWLGYLFPMWIMMYSFDFQSRMNLNLIDATFLFSVGTLSQFTPAPGGIGVYHSLIQTAMVRIYGIMPEEALAYATLTHGINLIVCFVIGGAFFVYENRIYPLPKDLDEIEKETLG
ncbi:MAG: lysylphosphatidylglycerol synthase transmembrane domain-containing protein [bacterium]